jgi:hypothetical protein
MNTRWFKGLTDQQKKELKASYLQADVMRAQLVAMLEEDIDNSLKDMRRAARLGSASLSELYADELAVQRTLESVISYLTEKVK